MQKVDLHKLCQDRCLPLTGSKAVLARRLALYKEEDAFEKPLVPAIMGQLLGNVGPKEGDIVTCTVEDTQDFGAFVRVEESGLPGIIHIRELSNSYVYKVEDVVQKGDTLEAMVIDSPVDRNRLSLSIRKLKALGTEAVATKAAAWRGFRYQPGPSPAAGMESTAALQRRARGKSRVAKQLDIYAETIRRIDLNVTAIEALLLQLGHGPRLRTFQEEIRVGLRNMESKFDRFLHEAEEQELRKADQKRAKPMKEEQQAIDAMLGEILSLQPMVDAAAAAAASSSSSGQNSATDASDK